MSIGLISLLLVFNAVGIDYDNIVIEEGGEIWIEGSAGPVDYKCQVQRLSGVGEISNTEDPRQNVKQENAVEITVRFPVKALDCGKEAMNRDMYEALKAGDYPTISYRLLDTKMMGHQGTEQDGWMQIRTRGIMTIAGVRDTTFVNVKGKLISEDRFRVTGQKRLHMDSYDIQPPTALMGLIKANENLTVHFDVTVRLKR